MKAILSVLIFLCLSLASSAYAANHYVLASASGTGTGADWTNATTALPASGTLVRNDTYYIGVGNYAAYTFNDTQVGSQVITVKKATVADHGTSTGWSDSFAGQTNLTATVAFLRGYYVFDGQTRNESDWFDGAAYGFQVTQLSEVQGIWSKRIGIATPNITIKYVYVKCITTPLTVGVFRHGISSDNQNGQVNTGLVVSHNYVEGCTQPYFVRLTDGALVEYNASKNATSSPNNHGEIFNLYFSANNAIIRYNQVRDAYVINPGLETPTSVVSITQTSGHRIYGNIFTNFRGGNAVIGYHVDNNQSSDILIYNNTFDQCNSSVQGRGGIVLGNDSVNNYAYNNIWTNCGDIDLTTSFINHDYNAFPGATTHSEAHEQLNMVSTIYANYAAKDFRLNSATTAGTTLGSPYDVDMLGSTRGADGTWDRGAFEVTVGVTPNTPTGFNMALNHGSTWAIPQWTPDTSGNWYGTYVFRCTATGACSNLIGTITAASAAAAHSPITRWVDSQLLAAGTYYYTISHFASNGNISTLSSEVTVAVTGKP